jgi:tripartite-type tricarboxylate transporter receptor subunit TctC
MFRPVRLLALVLLGLFCQSAMAQNAYPNKPIRILVPNAPGGPTDVLARLIADEAQALLGQPVVVENRDGAAGQIAARAVIAAPADGYTLLMGNTGVIGVTPLLYRTPGYKVEDFAAISMVTKIPIILVVRSDLGANTLAELIKLMKSNPKAMTFMSPGVGQSTHMAAELFRMRVGTNEQTIIAPTRGNSQSLTAILANDGQGMFDVFTTLPQIQAGSLKALAIAGPERSRLLPDVPTMKEAGLDNFNVVSWYGLVAKAGTPPEIVEKLNSVVVQILKRPDVKTRMAAINSDPAPTTAAEAQKYLLDEKANWTTILSNIGAKQLD